MRWLKYHSHRKLSLSNCMRTVARLEGISAQSNQCPPLACANFRCGRVCLDQACSDCLPHFAGVWSGFNTDVRLNVLQTGNCCRCAPGYYCPSTSEQVICPKRSFCPEQSERPRPCIWLTSCPEGTIRPKLSFGAFVFVAAAAVIMLASFVYVRRAVGGQRARAGMLLPCALPSGCRILQPRLSNSPRQAKLWTLCDWRIHCSKGGRTGAAEHGENTARALGPLIW